MKRKIMQIIFILLVSIPVSGCAPYITINFGSDDPVEEDVTETYEETETVNNEDVRDAYISFMNGEIPAYFEDEEVYYTKDSWDVVSTTRDYAMLDLDGDNVDELIINCNWNRPAVFSFVDGKITNTCLPDDIKYSETVFLKDGTALIRNFDEGILMCALYRLDKDHKYHKEEVYRHYYAPYRKDLWYDEYIKTDCMNDYKVTKLTKEEYKYVVTGFFDNALDINWEFIPSLHIEPLNITISEDKCRKMSYEEKLNGYTVDWNYEGSLGDIFPEYDNIILNESIPPCHVERHLSDGGRKVFYQIKSGDRVYFQSDEYDNIPYSVQVFTFKNMYDLRWDDIAVTSYIDSTDGFVVDSYKIYSYSGETGQWTYTGGSPSEGYDQLIQDTINEEAEKYGICKRPYAVIRDIYYGYGHIDYLFDMGYKDGPDVVRDYSVAYVFTESDIEPIVRDFYLEYDWPYDI